MTVWVCEALKRIEFRRADVAAARRAGEGLLNRTSGDLVSLPAVHRRQGLLQRFELAVALMRRAVDQGMAVQE